MNELLLDNPTSEELHSDDASAVFDDDLSFTSGEWLHGTKAEKDQYREQIRILAERTLDLEIEYMPSPEFSLPNAADFILAAVPSEEEGSGSGKPLPKAPAETPPYLAALYSIPLLTKDQEYHLFRMMNYLKYRADRLRCELDPEQPSIAILDQIETFLSQALSVRNQIVQANLRLVVSIAKKFVDSANSFDDLVSEGNLPLVRAVEIFDFERGTRFSTYATWAIRNSLYRATQRNRRIRRRYRTDHQEGLESVRDHRRFHRSQESFHAELRDGLKELLRELDDRDRTIVMDRFGLNGRKRPLKFREIAERLNISTERVRQLLARSLNQLETLAEHSPLEPED